jgi:hypothetical protein
MDLNFDENGLIGSDITGVEAGHSRRNVLVIVA